MQSKEEKKTFKEQFRRVSLTYRRFAMFSWLLSLAELFTFLQMISLSWLTDIPSSPKKKRRKLGFLPSLGIQSTSQQIKSPDQASPKKKERREKTTQNFVKVRDNIWNEALESLVPNIHSWLRHLSKWPGHPTKDGKFAIFPSGPFTIWS